MPVKPPETVNLYVSSLNDCLKQFKLGSEEQRINALKTVEMLGYAGGSQLEQVYLFAIQQTSLTCILYSICLKIRQF